MDYVVGFAFTEDLDQLVLIRKTKPAWQRGKLNGVGGKIEKLGDSYMIPGQIVVPEARWELPHDAMVREFEEETGVLTELTHWRPFGLLEGYNKEKIYLLTTRTNRVLDVTTTTEERIELVDPHRLPSNVVPNVRWLVPAALDYHRNPVGFSFLTAEYNR